MYRVVNEAGETKARCLTLEEALQTKLVEGNENWAVVRLIKKEEKK